MSLVRGRQRRGFTVIEMLVVCFLAVLLLTIGVRVIFPLFKVTDRVSQRVELQQLATLVLDRLSRDFSSTQAAGVTPPSVTADSVLFALHPVASVSAQGRQFWDDTVTVYYWREETGQLIRQPWSEPNLTMAPRQLTPAELLQAATDGHPDARPIASNITEFSLLPARPGPGLVLPLQARAVFRLDYRDSPGARLELERKFYLMNSSF